MDLLIQIASACDEQARRYACGVVVFDQTTARAVHEAGYALGELDSPNAADYRALLEALRMALPLTPEQVEVRCGSQRLVNQITGAEPLGREDDRPLHEQVLMQLLRLDTWRIGAVERSANRRAAELAEAALRRGEDVVALDGEETPVMHKRRFTGVPQWTVELLEEPGSRCPARCHEGMRYAFGPDTPGGFCVHAVRAVVEDGPLTWTDPDQRRMTTLCPHCEAPLRIVMAE